MVFKKPYAFLIKNFKIIHALLTIFSVYLIMRVSAILEFFDKYINTSINKIEAVNYINNTYILVIILSIIICLIIWVLMKYKKKPHLLYLILIAVYLAIGFVIGYANNGLNTIYTSVMSMKDLLIISDVLKIMLVIQYISVCFVLVRALGFDIKKFDFDAEKEGFSVVEEDNEEVEFTLKDTNKYERTFRRRLREFKYYYFENKLFINGLLGIVAVIFVAGLFVNKEIVNKVYSENENFSTENFSFVVTNSYISNIGYDRKKIMNNNTSFVIVKLRVKNNNEAKKLNNGNVMLLIDDKSYTNKVLYANRFKDLGNVYNEHIIKRESSYILIFNVYDEMLDDDIYFCYGSEKKVKLNPLNLDKVSEVENYKLNNELDFSKSFLGSGSINIKAFSLSENFKYDYTYEVMGQTFNSSITIKGVNKMILKLDMSSSYDNTFEWLNTYATLKYKIGDKEYTSSFTDKTPNGHKDGLYLAVDKEIDKADKIWFDIVLRNKSYVYEIK